MDNCIAVKYYVYLLILSPIIFLMHALWQNMIENSYLNILKVKDNRLSYLCCFVCCLVPHSHISGEERVLLQLE